MAGGCNINTESFQLRGEQDSGLMNESRSGCEMSRILFTGLTVHQYFQR